MKILVVKRDKLGDLLLATPMFAVLRRSLPGARIDLLASDYNAWLVQESRDLDRTWTYRRVRHGDRLRPAAALSQLATFARLRAERYDVAIAANGEPSPRATRRAILAGAQRTIAYVDEPVRGLSDPLPAPAAGHELQRLLNLLQPLGIPFPEAIPLPALDLPAAFIDQADAWLASNRLAAGSYVVIGLGARKSSRQPGAAQVVRWSEMLFTMHSLRTVFMWTPGRADDALYPGDDEAAAQVLAANSPHIHPFRGPLPPAIGLVWRARCSIFPDSGLMHVAAASPGGVLGLFAQTDISPPPSRWAPRGRHVDFVEAPNAISELEDSFVMQRFSRLLAGTTPG